MLARVILEWAYTHAMEIYEVTSTLMETWDPHLAHTATWRVFISYEPPLAQYIKINFDGSVMDRWDGASFIIRGSGLGLVITRRRHLVEPTVPMVELRGAWVGIVYAQKILGANHMIIEGNSATIVT